MEDKFLIFLETNKIDKNDAVAQLYLLALEQSREIKSIREKIETSVSQEETMRQLSKIIKEDLVVGVDNAEIKIDYEKLAREMVRVERYTNDNVVLKGEKKVGLLAIIQGLFFSEKVLG